MSTLAILTKKYLQDLEEKQRRTSRTAQNYHLYLNRFLQWSKVNNPKDINNSVVIKFENHLKNLKGRQRNLTPATINYHLIALRNFIKYLNQHHHKVKVKNQIKLNKIKYSTPRELAPTQLSRLVNAPTTTSDRPLIKLRDKALLEILITTGLKLSELASIKISDINLSKKELAVESFNSRVLPLDKRTVSTIREYLKLRPGKNPYLFLSLDQAARQRQQNNKPLTGRSIERLIEKYAKLAGLPKQISPNTLRHQFAISLIKNGEDAQALQESLGYISEQTVKRYQS